MRRYHENPDRIVYQTFKKKKQSQGTITKFIKTLVKSISEKNTDEITYVRMVADEQNEMQHYRKSLD